MPRVVPDQKTKFETDELFKKLSQDVDVYTRGLVCGWESRACMEEPAWKSVNPGPMFCLHSCLFL